MTTGRTVHSCLLGFKKFLKKLKIQIHFIQINFVFFFAGEVHYSIVASSANGFSIDYENGWIKVYQKLDSRSNPVTLLVRAKDSGQPAQSSTINCAIHIIDINDHVWINYYFKCHYSYQSIFSGTISQIKKRQSFYFKKKNHSINC